MILIIGFVSLALISKMLRMAKQTGARASPATAALPSESSTADFAFTPARILEYDD